MSSDRSESGSADNKAAPISKPKTLSFFIGISTDVCDRTNWCWNAGKCYFVPIHRRDKKLASPLSSAGKSGITIPELAAPKNAEAAIFRARALLLG